MRTGKPIQEFKLGVKLYRIENFQLVNYKLAAYKTTKDGNKNLILQCLDIEDSPRRIIVNNLGETYFLSKLMALTELETRLEIILSTIRRDLLLEKGKIFRTDNMKSFVDSCKDLSDIDIQKEITTLRLEEVYNEENHSIYKKQV